MSQDFTHVTLLASEVWATFGSSFLL